MIVAAYVVGLLLLAVLIATLGTVYEIVRDTFSALWQMITGGRRT